MQKEKWLPGFASAETLPTAVFTEPNTGYDLGSLRTGSEGTATTYKVTGQNMDHACSDRTHVRLFLARDDPQTSITKDYRCLGRKRQVMDGKTPSVEGMNRAARNRSVAIAV